MPRAIPGDGEPIEIFSGSNMGLYCFLTTEGLHEQRLFSIIRDEYCRVGRCSGKWESGDWLFYDALREEIKNELER